MGKSVGGVSIEHATARDTQEATLALSVTGTKSADAPMADDVDDATSADDVDDVDDHTSHDDVDDVDYHTSADDVDDVDDHTSADDVDDADDHTSADDVDDADDGVPNAVVVVQGITDMVNDLIDNNFGTPPPTPAPIAKEVDEGN